MSIHFVFIFFLCKATAFLVSVFRMVMLFLAKTIDNHVQMLLLGTSVRKQHLMRWNFNSIGELDVT